METGDNDDDNDDDVCGMYKEEEVDDIIDDDDDDDAEDNDIEHEGDTKWDLEETEDRGKFVCDSQCCIDAIYFRDSYYNNTNL